MLYIITIFLHVLAVSSTSLSFFFVCVYAKTLFIYPRGIVFESLIRADHLFGVDIYAEAVFNRQVK